jgi:hypothetical protein
MKLNVTLFFLFAMVQVLYGYITDERWLASCGIIILGIVGIMTCLWDAKDEIIKAIRETRGKET